MSCDVYTLNMEYSRELPRSPGSLPGRSAVSHRRCRSGIFEVWNAEFGVCDTKVYLHPLKGQVTTTSMWSRGHARILGRDMRSRLGQH